MGNLNEWLVASEPFTQVKAREQISTTETYDKIREMGLPTVFYKSFSNLNHQTRESISAKIENFVNSKNPCLFIYDSKVPTLKKNYLFGVNTFSPINDWLKENSLNMHLYSYLITTQINNPGNGFVGSMLSDGAGNMFCETLHHPGVCNHRTLSQTAIPDIFNLDDFTIEDFNIENAKGKFLTFDNIQELKNLYEGQRGYFEFVKGVQCGKDGIYTTGFENISHKFSYPYCLHNNTYSNLSQRLIAAEFKAHELANQVNIK